jgi:hypothetical protein
MTERPRFSRRRILGAQWRSLKLDLLQYQGRDLPPKFLLVSFLLQCHWSFNRLHLGF